VDKPLRMGTANPDPFLLRWNDFYSNITTGFKDLRDDYEFLDVTVACEEEQLNAHKVILSACSPYFRSLLKKHPAQHPVLIMPANVKYKFIHSLVDFMYHGEVAIPHEDLNQFLEIAAQFKVKGLTEEKVKPSHPRAHSQGPKSGPRPSPHPSTGPGISPGVQQRLPSGIHMVKRQRGGESQTPGKRPRLGPGLPPPPQPHSTVQPPSQGNQQHQGFQDTGEDEEDDDVTEIREGDESNDYYEAHEGYEEQYAGGMPYGDGTEDTQTMPPPTAGPPAPAAGPQLMGLLCPNCRSMCQGVQALKDHMLVCQGQGGSGRPQGGQQPNYPANSGQPGPPAEDPQECHVCDKSFKSHRTLDNHMKKQHGIPAPPKPTQGNRKPRRPKKQAGDTSESWQGPGYPQIGEDYDSQPNQQQYQGGFLESVTPEKQTKEVVDKPVGQVAPAQRSSSSSREPGPAPVPSKPPTPIESHQRPPSADGNRGMASGRMVRGRGGPMMGRGMSRGGPHGGPHMRPGPGQEGPRPDLQKLGLKFGGQISITSTGNQARRAAGQQQQQQGGVPVMDMGAMGGAPGVSITKLKGDNPVGSPVSIRDVNNRPGGGNTPQSQAGSTPGRGEQEGPIVKEEPKDFDVVEEELDEGDMEGGEQDDFGEYADYAEGDIGPGGDGMYGDEEEFEEMEGEGMEGEDDFSGRGGMFQGQYGAGEYDPDMEGEYEDEG